MRPHLLALAVAGLITFSGCKKDDPTSPLLHTRWKLVQVEETPVAISSYSGASRSYIEFTRSGNTASGLAPCNSFDGVYSLGSGEGQLSISLQVVTSATCPGQNLEDQYLNALPRTTRYEISGNELRLYDASNALRPLLLFEAQR